MDNKAPITVKATVNAPVEKVWDYYNSPDHVTKWNNASEDWHTPTASNNLEVGGTFSYRMEAKDGSAGFDFEGTYEQVDANAGLSYVMSDGRKVKVTFESKENNTTTDVTVIFDPETENAPEFQQQGWQAILDNFKKYVESTN